LICCAKKRWGGKNVDRNVLDRKKLLETGRMCFRSMIMVEACCGEKIVGVFMRCLDFMTTNFTLQSNLITTTTSNLREHQNTSRTSTQLPFNSNSRNFNSARISTSLKPFSVQLANYSSYKWRD
jgi:hypothetical protein